MSNFADLEAAEVAIGASDEERRRRREVLEQRSGDALKKKWQEEDREALAEAEALIAPPIITIGQCQTCQSDYRAWIERELVRGISYAAITRHLERSVPGEAPSRKSIANHFKEHMALDQAAIRMVLEEEASVLGQNVEEGVKGAFTLRGALEVLIRKAYEDALNNVTTVEPKDLVQMAKLYNELNANAGTTAMEEARTAITTFMAAIQNTLVKGDIITRELGYELVRAISDEVTRLKEEQEIEVNIERHLVLPGG